MQNYGDVDVSVCEPGSSTNKPSVFFRPSMSGLHLVKKGREHKKMDLQRDFTVASPAEFVTRFGGHRVIEKVAWSRLSALASVSWSCSFSAC